MTGKFHNTESRWFQTPNALRYECAAIAYGSKCSVGDSTNGMMNDSTYIIGLPIEVEAKSLV